VIDVGGSGGDDDDGGHNGGVGGGHYRITIEIDTTVTRTIKLFTLNIGNVESEDTNTNRKTPVIHDTAHVVSIVIDDDQKRVTDALERRSRYWLHSVTP